jgi:hypothetical protein
MGITCKQFGKMRGIMKKVDNQIEAGKAIKREKNTRKRINKIGQPVKVWRPKQTVLDTLTIGISYSQYIL